MWQCRGHEEARHDAWVIEDDEMCPWCDAMKIEWTEVDPKLPHDEEHRLPGGAVRPEGYEPRTPHKMVVRSVGDSDWDFDDYDIEHGEACPYYVSYPGTDHEFLSYECDVGYQQTEGGDIKYSLRYSGTPVTAPGEYWIVAWFETIRGFDFTEYDGGVHLVDAPAEPANECEAVATD